MNTQPDSVVRIQSDVCSSSHGLICPPSASFPTPLLCTRDTVQYLKASRRDSLSPKTIGHEHGDPVSKSGVAQGLFDLASKEAVVTDVDADAGTA